MPNHPEISVVSPCYNEESCLPELVSRVCVALRSMKKCFEVILIDDGSTDKTQEVLQQLKTQYPELKPLQLDKNVGQQKALLAGLSVAKGDLIISMDSDLQDPPELLPSMVESWRSGAELVFTQRSSRDSDSFMKKFCAYCFYFAVSRLSGGSIVIDSGEFRALDRKCMDRLLKQSANIEHPCLRVMVANLEGKRAVVHYRRPARFSGEPKFSFLDSLKLATHGLQLLLKQKIKSAFASDKGEDCPSSQTAQYSAHLPKDAN